MDFVMSETKVVEEMIDKGKLKDKQVGKAIPLLTKYFYQIKGMNKKQTYDATVKFLQSANSSFREANNMFYIDKCIGHAKNVKLIDIDHISITRNEMDTIRCIGKKNLERLAFVVLCLCKYHRAARNSESLWVSYEHKDMFKMARLTNGEYYNELCFHELYKLGLITPSRISGKNAVKVEFLDEDSESALELKDMRELSYEYLNYIGDGRFIRCKDCGILVKVNNKDNYTCRCKQCQNIENMRLNRERVARCRENKAVM